MNKQQIAWARQHDWFFRADSDGVFVREYRDDGTPMATYFDDFKALKDWAGY